VFEIVLPVVVLGGARVLQRLDAGGKCETFSRSPRVNIGSADPDVICQSRRGPPSIIGKDNFFIGKMLMRHSLSSDKTAGGRKTLDASHHAARGGGGRLICV
jgi:hypothetical protein